MACAVLAADPSLRDGNPSTNCTLDAEIERRRTKLANACRLLEKVGEKSPVARNMVRRLVGLLRKHRVHGLGEDKSVPTIVQGTEGATSAAALINSGDVSEKLQEQPDQQELAVDLMRPSQFQEGQQVDGQNWAYDPLDPTALTGIWNDFLGTVPTINGWEQLFTDLDYLSGGI